MSMKNSSSQLSWAGKIAHYFIKNTKLSLLLLLAILVWGALSFFITPKQYNPDITAPTFQINLYAPSADAEEFHDRITKEVEHAMNGLEGIDDILSVTQEGGYGMITVQFDIGFDTQQANLAVRQRMDEVRGTLPHVVNEVDRITIEELDPDDVPVMTLALTDESQELHQLYSQARGYRDQIKQIDGISKVEIFGGETKQMKVKIDQDSIEETGIIPSSIIQKIRQDSTRFFITDEAEEGGQRKSLTVDGLARGQEDLEQLVVGSDQGEPVELQDIAKVVYEPQKTKSYTRFVTEDDRDQAIFMAISKKPETNVTQLTDRVQQVVDTTDLAAEVNVVRDDGVVAQESIFGLVGNLVVAIIIVASILFLFLGWKAALVASVAIPLTISSVFGVAYLTDQTINRITLFALILSLGLLVDNATVIVENAIRHIKEKTGKSPQESVAFAVDEVGSSLFLATLTTLFAFFPMLFVTGMMGPYMQPIPFFVPVALVVSLIIAFTLNPFLISQLFKKGQVSEQKSSGFVQSFYQWYEDTLRGLFRHNVRRHLLLLGSGLLTVAVLLMPVFQVVEFRMLPKDDKQQFFLHLDYPVDITLSENSQETQVYEDALLAHEDVVSVQSYVATPPVIDFNGLFRGSGNRQGIHQSTLRVNLTHPDDRELSSEEIVQELRTDMEDLSEYDPETVFVEEPPGPPVRSTAFLTVKGIDQENIQEEERAKLQEISQDMTQLFQDTEGVVDVHSQYQDPLETISLQVDKEEASKRNLRTSQIASYLSTAMDGQMVTLYRDRVDKPREAIVVTFAGDLEENIDLDDLKIAWSSPRPTEINGEIVKPYTDQQVSLSEVVTVERFDRDNLIFSENQNISYAVGGEMEGRSVVYATIDMIPQILDYQLPFTDETRLVDWNLYQAEFEDQETGQRYLIDWGGEWELTLDVFRDLGIAMAVAILLIYGILVGQFQSFKIPFLILGTVPMALIGVLPGYAVLTANSSLFFNAPSMIGVIALAGIVVNNAIIMVEYIRQLQQERYDFSEAITVGARTRLRPIVLTALTTVLGSLTLVTDPVWAGLGWSIGFGMTVSTILTLGIFPLLYYQFMKKDS